MKSRKTQKIQKSGVVHHQQERTNSKTSTTESEASSPSTPSTSSCTFVNANKQTKICKKRLFLGEQIIFEHSYFSKKDPPPGFYDENATNPKYPLLGDPKNPIHLEPDPVFNTGIDAISDKELLAIFHLVPIEELMQLELVCKRWRWLALKACNDKTELNLLPLDTTSFRNNLNEISRYWYFVDFRLQVKFEDVIFSVRRQVNTAGVEWLAERFPNITKLRIYNLDQLLEVTQFGALIQHWCKSLEELVLFIGGTETKIYYNCETFWSAMYKLEGLKHLVLPFTCDQMPSDVKLRPIFRNGLKSLYHNSGAGDERLVEAPAAAAAAQPPTVPVDLNDFLINNMNAREREQVQLHAQQAIQIAVDEIDRTNQPNQQQQQAVKNGEEFPIEKAWIIKQDQLMGEHILCLSKNVTPGSPGLNKTDIAQMGYYAPHYALNNRVSAVIIPQVHNIVITSMMELLVSYKDVLTKFDFEVASTIQLAPLLPRLSQLSKVEQFRITARYDPNRLNQLALFGGDLTRRNYTRRLNPPMKSVKMFHLSRFNIRAHDPLFMYLRHIFPELEELHFEDCTFVRHCKWLRNEIKLFPNLARVYHNHRVVLECAAPREGDTERRVMGKIHDLYEPRVRVN